MPTKHSIVFIIASWIAILSTISGAIMLVYRWHYEQFETIENAQQYRKMAYIRELGRDMALINSELIVYENLIKQGHELDATERREYNELNEVKQSLLAEIKKATNGTSF